jgi:hypothetical protein
VAIREFSSGGVPRATVAFFQELPAEQHLTRFIERKFTCVPCSEADLARADFVAQLDAVIFSQNPQQRNALSTVLGARLPTLLNHGVRVYVRTAPDPDGTPVARALLVEALIALNLPLANITPAERARIPDASRGQRAEQAA